MGDRAERLAGAKTWRWPVLLLGFGIAVCAGCDEPGLEPPNASQSDAGGPMAGAAGGAGGAAAGKGGNSGVGASGAGGAAGGSGSGGTTAGMDAGPPPEADAGDDEDAGAD